MDLGQESIDNRAVAAADLGRRTTDTEPLKTRTARLRAAIRAADGVMFGIAKEIVEIADHWATYRGEAECEAARWVHQIDPRRTLAWWREVHAAYERFGARNARYVTWEAARWAAKKVTADRWESAVDAIRRGFHDRDMGRSVALSRGQCRLVLSEFVTKTPATNRQAARVERLEDRVTQLEEFIVTMGLVVPEPR